LDVQVAELNDAETLEGKRQVRDGDFDALQDGMEGREEGAIRGGADADPGNADAKAAEETASRERSRGGTGEFGQAERGFVIHIGRKRRDRRLSMFPDVCRNLTMPQGRGPARVRLSICM